MPFTPPAPLARFMPRIAFERSSSVAFAEALLTCPKLAYIPAFGIGGRSGWLCGCGYPGWDDGETAPMKYGFPRGGGEGSGGWYGYVYGPESGELMASAAAA